MEGAFQESGPLWSAPGGATLQLNEYTWNKFATTVYIEAPAGVGFSYADTPSGTVHNDTSTAIDNLASLLALYEKFPEWKRLPFWISGESYAGLYIPMLAYNIYQYNINAVDKIPLRGILVGNGCIGAAAGICSRTGYADYLSLKQFHGHGFISDLSYDAAIAACGDWSVESPACINAVSVAANEVGTLVDIYDIYSGIWGVCNYNKMKSTRPVSPSSFLGQIIHNVDLAIASGILVNNCTDDNDLLSYMNLAATQTALNVKSTNWVDCGGITYDSDMQDERTEIYPTLVNKAEIEVVIFNGDADACVPITDNQWWTKSMNYPVAAPWSQWTASDGSLGGYVTRYAPAGNSNFTFITVRGSGHMVPSMQPLYAYDLAAHFVTGVPLGSPIIENDNKEL
jgi:carboxypeptidase C (cathepsin A)